MVQSTDLPFMLTCQLLFNPVIVLTAFVAHKPIRITIYCPISIIGPKVVNCVIRWI